jgi:hypothetical protein
VGFVAGNARDVNQLTESLGGVGRRRDTEREQSYGGEEKSAQSLTGDEPHGGIIATERCLQSVAIMDGSDSHVSTVPARAVLDNWAHADWTDGCQVDATPVFQTLTVVTRNSLYQLIVLDPSRGVVRLRGGNFFPDWREAQLAGCSLGGSFLKMRGIYAGFCMELHVDGETVITSPVLRLTLSQFDESSTPN